MSSTSSIRMIITRGLLLQGMISLFVSPVSVVEEMHPPQPTEKAMQLSPSICDHKYCQNRDAPANVDYNENPTVFGQILRGEVPAMILEETNDTLAFADRTPRAPLHGLIIPKRLVPSVFSLTRDDLPILEEMRRVALQLIQNHYPKAYEKGDYILCFHVPPFNSVDHLHLHMLAPASQMKLIYRFGKYQVGTRWCAGFEDVRKRLASGKPAVSYKHDPTYDYTSWFRKHG